MLDVHPFLLHIVVAPFPIWVADDEGVQRAASPWRTLGIRSCRTICSDLA